MQATTQFNTIKHKQPHTYKLEYHKLEFEKQIKKIKNPPKLKRIWNIKHFFK